LPPGSGPSTLGLSTIGCLGAISPYSSANLLWSTQIGWTISPVAIQTIGKGNMVDSSLAFAMGYYNSALSGVDPYLLFVGTQVTTFAGSSVGRNYGNLILPGVGTNPVIVAQVNLQNVPANGDLVSLVSLIQTTNTTAIANYIGSQPGAGVTFNVGMFICETKNTGSINLTESPILYAENISFTVSAGQTSYTYPLPISFANPQVNPVWLYVNSSGNLYMIVTNLVQSGNSITLYFSGASAAPASVAVIAIQNTQQLVQNVPTPPSGQYDVEFF
jgi:hypothetical protein